MLTQSEVCAITNKLHHVEGIGIKYNILSLNLLEPEFYI